MNMDLRQADNSFYVGHVFKNKTDFKHVVALYFIQQIFHSRIHKSDRHRIVEICGDSNCSWRIYGHVDALTACVEVRKVFTKHSCNAITRSKFHKIDTKHILADLLSSQFGHGKEGPRARDILDSSAHSFIFPFLTLKAWNAKELALARTRGSEEERFSLLTSYLHLLHASNLRTLYSLQTSPSPQGDAFFKYLFFAIGAPVHGFPFMRKVVVIDGTQLKGKFKGFLVAASAQDGNMQIFPLTFGVIDSENEASWSWFLTQLKCFVSNGPDIVFVSDRHPSIIKSLKAVYPLSLHGACVVHLCCNVNHRFKSSALATICSNAARAFTLGDFNYWFEQIKSHSNSCADYLHEIGFQHWALSHFPGHGWNIMTFNIAESLNVALSRAFSFPIVSLVEFIRTMLMRWFCDRRTLALKTTSICTPQIEKVFSSHLRAATECTIIFSSEWLFQVNDSAGCVFEVDLKQQSCSCNVFSVLRFPCSHALAVAGGRGIDLYSLVSPLYKVDSWKKAYKLLIYPVPNAKDTSSPSHIQHSSIKPPKTRRPSGRPRKLCILSRGEAPVRLKKYGRCHGIGHYRNSCKNPI